MKSVQIVGSRDNHTVTFSPDSVSIPSPQNDDVLVRVHAAGITADEASWPELYRTSDKIPGHDLSGVVSKLGPSYKGPLRPGDEVFAMLKADSEAGCQAEYAVASPEELAIKPASLSHAQAAALPIPFLTAWEAIYEHAKVQRGSKVLITGASGAVGLCMVQIASGNLQCKVSALGSARNHAFLREFGAHTVVDYNDATWEELVQDVDVVLDTVGSRILERCQSCVKSNGTIVTVADPPPPWASDYGNPTKTVGERGVSGIYFIVRATGFNLSRLDGLLKEKKIRPIPIKAFKDSAALDAWEYAGRRGKEGKAIIEFA